MKKISQRVIVSFLSIFMLISSSGMAVVAEGNKTGGRDVSAYFDAEVLDLKVNNIPFYDGSDSSIQGPADYESDYGATIAFNLKWFQSDTSMDTFYGGDYLILDLFTLKSDQLLSLSQFSSGVYLNIGNIQIGTGEVIAKMSDDKKEATIQYKIVFNDNIADFKNIELKGESDGSFGINKGTTLAHITGIIDDENDFSFTINPPYIAENYRRPDTLFSRDMKKGNNHYLESNGIMRIRWEVEAFSHLRQGIEDFRSGQDHDYEPVIFEEILDENQFFIDDIDAESSKTKTPSLTFGFPVVMNALPEDDYFLINETDRIYRHGRVSFLTFSLKNLEERGLIRKITDGDNAARKAEVLSSSGVYKWTVIEEDGVQKLFVNFGKPGGDLLNYATLLEKNTYNYPLFGESGNMELKSLDRLVEDLKDEEAYYKALLGTDHDSCDGKCPIDNGAGVADLKCAYWKKYLKMTEETVKYYESNPGVFGFRVYVDSYVKEDKVNLPSLTSVKNDYKLYCGSEIASASATLQAKWNLNFYGELRDGDIQLFKYDSRYTNESVDTKNPSRQGGMEGVLFEVYKASDTTASNPIHFNYNDETNKYEYNQNGSHTQLVTDEDGLIVVSGLARDDYYFKEVNDVDGYYAGQNQKVDFTIENDKVLFAHVENTVREVELFKHDGKNRALKGAEFEVYKNGGTEALTFVEEEIEGKTYYKYDTNGSKTLTVDDKGKLYLSHLDEGEYYFKEVKAPEGYQLSDKQWKFEMSKSEIPTEPQVVKVENERLKGNIVITKVDSESQAVLGGSKFILARENLLSRQREYLSENDTWVTEKLNAKTFITNTLGQIEIDNLERSTYIVIETEAPKDYYTPEGEEAEHIVVVNSSEELITITNNRIPKGDVLITKVDNEQLDVALPGAEFILSKEIKENENTKKVYYTIENNEIKWVEDSEEAKVFTTDNNGQITITDLEANIDYILIETKAPNGYTVLTDEVEKTFTIDEDKQVEVTIKNSKMPTDPIIPMPEVEHVSSLVVTKIDEKTSDNLKGAEFVVAQKQEGFLIFPAKYVYYSLDNNGLVTWVENIKDAKVFTSGTNGKVTVDDLPRDQEYVLIETKAPEGYYVLTEDKETEFTVGVDQSIIELTIKNSKMPTDPTIPMPGVDPVSTLIATKVDAKTSEKLEGAEFVVSKKQSNQDVYYALDNNGLVTWVENIQDAKTFISGIDGKVTVDDLPRDQEYVLIETKAPEGYYVLTEDKETEFTVGVDQSIIELTVKNSKMPTDPTIPMPTLPELAQIEITKVDSEDDNIVLSDAKFIVANDSSGIREYYSLDKDGIVEWVRDIQDAMIFVTDANGQSIIQQLELEETYILIEVEAPEGYLLPNNNETIVEVRNHLNAVIIKNTFDDGDVLGEGHENPEDKKKEEVSKDKGNILGEKYVKTSDDTNLIRIIALMIMSMMVVVVTKKEKQDS